MPTTVVLDRDVSCWIRGWWVGKGYLLNESTADQGSDARWGRGNVRSGRRRRQGDAFTVGILIVRTWVGDLVGISGLHFNVDGLITYPFPVDTCASRQSVSRGPRSS